MTDSFENGATGLVDIMRELYEIEDPHSRANNLFAWARSEFWHPCLMICEDWQGSIAREAYALLKRELEAETPGRLWWNADHKRGRRQILSALKIDGEHPSAFYATFPFRTVEVEGKLWIAGAVGCPRILSSDWVTKWAHIDIEEVLLWNPRTGEIGILGEASGQAAAFVPERLAFVEECLTVYADGYSFFRAWADRRAITRTKIVETKKTHVRPIEPCDSDVSGAFVIGDVAKNAHRLLNVKRLVAGPGVDAKAIKRAIFRAANLPTVEAA